MQRFILSPPSENQGKTGFPSFHIGITKRCDQSIFPSIIQALFRYYSGITQVLLKLYSGFTQALLRLYSGFTQALLRLYSRY